MCLEFFFFTLSTPTCKLATCLGNPVTYSFKAFTNYTFLTKSSTNILKMHLKLNQRPLQKNIKKNIFFCPLFFPLEYFAPFLSEVQVHLFAFAPISTLLLRSFPAVVLKVVFTSSKNPPSLS